ncbi:hypothetical protein SMICM17S_08178 [Streptomyces microflavus]
MSATRYAYLGPEGTFTEVALRTLPEAATRELVPMVAGTGGPGRCTQR